MSDSDYDSVDPSDLILRDQRQTMSTTLSSLEDDPQKASRAFELGQATGDHPALIYSNLENYETQHKAALTSQLLNSSKYLRQYVEADPMHAKISNDDYGNLDNVSQRLIQSSLPGMVVGMNKSIFSGAVEGFRKGWESVTSAPHLTDEEIRNYPLFSALMQSARFPVDVGGALIAAGTEAIKSGTETAYIHFTGDEMGAQRFGREMAAMAETVLTNTSGYHGIGKPSPAQLEKVHGILDKAKPWLDDNREPPRFLDPEIDKLKFDQNKIDLDNLDEALKASTQSATRERNPDIFADFIRQHTDAQIGISGDAVAKIYGEKIPEAGDNILGWSPRIAEELAIAKETGGDVHILLADWLAKVDPEVAKVLHDDIRVRPGGITKFEKDSLAEAKEGLEEWKPSEPLPEAVPSVRGAASLEPLFSIGDRKLELKKITRNPKDTRPTWGEGFHDFTLLDETGKDVGTINLSEARGGRQLYIEMINGLKGYGPLSFGPALMRDLLRQLKAEFPEAETITGHRVSGAREKADSFMKPSASPVIKLDNPGWSEIEGFRKVLEGGEWKSMGLGLEAYMKPTELLIKHEQELSKAIHDELSRITPKQVDVSTPSALRREGSQQNVRGAHTQYSDRNPFITVALDSNDPIGVARHEAIHHLRQQGFFKEGEWETLTRAARDEGWIERFGIEKRYAKLEQSGKLEEAIADGYRTWKEGKPTSPKAAAIFERLKEFFDAIKAKFKEILGHEPTWEELFQKVDEGEIGSREGNAPRREGAYRESVGEPELPGLTRIEDREAFDKAAAIGMTVDQYRRYMKLIEKRHAEDLASSISRAEAEQRKRQTKEWKDNEKEVRAQVSEGITNRPDVAADVFFQRGELFGEKLKEKPKIDSSLLSEEQRAALPKEYQSKDGMHPDDVAQLFGYKSGLAMIEQLSLLDATRKELKMTPAEFLKRVVDQETERQMQAKYGQLEKSILEEAKDQALSETQLSLLHEETFALATQAGLEFSLTKGELKRAVTERFQDSRAQDVSTDKFLRDAGKAGKAAEMALLKGDFAEAFREKQRQYLAISFANEAKAFEKAQARFEKTTKRLSQREVKGIDQEYTNFAQDLLQKAGVEVKRSPADIATAIEFTGYKDLTDFIESKNGDGWELAVNDALQAGRVKPLTEMSVAEFMDFKAAVDSLAHIGRETQKILVAGEKRDFVEWKAGVLENIRQLPVRDKTAPNRWAYKFDAMMTRTEELVKDLDLRQELGPLFNAVIRPMMAAKSKEYAMTEALATKLKEIKGFDKKWQKTLDDTIPQDFFTDPYDGTLFDLTRSNLIQIMLNWGNDSNRSKFVRGYASPETRTATKEQSAAFQGKLQQLIDTHATKADWDYVQAIWDLFHGWQKDADTVYRNTSGVAPRWIENEPLQTPHGEYKGGYYPIIYDRTRSNINVIEDNKPPTSGRVLSSDYFRASSSKGYTKERTGFSDRMQFTSSIEQVAMRMQQMIHDIAFREALIDVGKVLYDREIRGTIRKHYGEEYEAQLTPWLKRIANSLNQNEAAVEGATSLMRRARMNLVGHALPLNLKVLLSPDVGALNPMAVMDYVLNRKANMELAMEKSKEIPHTVYNMDRDFNEGLARTIASKGWSSYQSDAVKWGFAPVVKVSEGFRTVTFVSKYKEALAQGKPENEAIAIADSHVRERHGAASVVDLPAVMQSTEGMKLMTMFYGFFNTMYNWQRQIPGNLRRGEYGDAWSNLWGSVLLPAGFGALLFNQQKESDSWFKTIAKALIIQPMSTMVFARDISNIMLEGYGPRTPVATVISALSSAFNDVKRWQKKEPIEKPIQHTANVVGLFGGVPGMAQIGRTGQFAYDVAKGKQRPRNIIEWSRGIIQGEARLKK